jgi:hypothetical protein
MKSSESNSRYAGAIVGGGSLLSLLIINLTTSATTGMVWFLGHETHLGCWFKDKFHLPCPVCGMTRSVVLALHGSFSASLNLHIGGFLSVFGLFLFGLTMLYLAFFKPAPNLQRKTFLVFSSYFVGVTLISLVYWIFRLFGYFQTLPELAHF